MEGCTIDIPHYTEEITVSFYQIGDSFTSVSQNVGEELRNTAYSVSDIINDTDAVSISVKRNITPHNGVEWKTDFGTDGRRGSSRCYPTDPELMAKMKKIGNQEYVRYDSKCNPDFRPFSYAEIRIPDMTDDRAINFRSAKLAFLKTKQAKDLGLRTIRDVDRFIADNNITLHESSDGVSVLFVDRDIHAKFGHSGGFSVYKAINGIDAQDKVTFLDQINKRKYKFRKTVVSAEKSFNDAMEELRDYAPAFVGKAGTAVRFFTESDIHQAGIKAATDAAVFAGTMAVVRNAYAVLQKEKDAGEAIEDVLYTTAASAASAYAMGALKSGIDKALKNTVSVDGIGVIATGVVQVSKNIIAYASGEIDGEQFRESIGETGAYLAAGYIGGNVGAFIGSGIGAALGSAIPFLGSAIGAEAGAFIGRMVGEIIATTVCAEVISALKYGKEYKKQSARVRALCSKAESAMRASQQRLREMIHEKNYELLLSCDEGFALISKALDTYDMSLLKGGILRIGSSFGIDEQYLSQGELTKSNLFSENDTVLVIS